MRIESNRELLQQSPYCNILASIPHGMDKARHSKDLAHSLGMRERVFRKHIEHIRRSGVVIIGSSKGYFFPASLDELNSYIRQEEASARSLLFTLKSARSLRKHWESSVFNHSIFDNGGNQNE